MSSGKAIYKAENHTFALKMPARASQREEDSLRRHGPQSLVVRTEGTWLTLQKWRKILQISLSLLETLASFRVVPTFP